MRRPLPRRHSRSWDIVDRVCAPLPVGTTTPSSTRDDGSLDPVKAAPPAGVVHANGWLLWRIDADGTARELTLCFTAVDTSPSAPTCDGVLVDGDAPEAQNPSVPADWRWERYAVAGRWDGEVFSPTSIVPIALYDQAHVRPVLGPDLGHGRDGAPPRAEPPTATELDRITALLPERLGDALLFVREASETSLRAHVVWDDGTLQHAVDVEFGDGVVAIVSELKRAE